MITNRRYDGAEAVESYAHASSGSRRTPTERATGPERPGTPYEGEAPHDDKDSSLSLDRLLSSRSGLPAPPTAEESMRHHIRFIWLSLAVLRFGGGAMPAIGQAPVDAELARYINTIRAIDGHAHPMRPVAPEVPADTEFDALPLDGIPPFDVPNRLKADHPIWRAAQAALYKIPLSQSGNDYHTSLKAAVSATTRARGQNFPTWALDQAGIDVMMANRIAMGPGLSAPRFRGVPFADALLLPLDRPAEPRRRPDTRR